MWVKNTAEFPLCQRVRVCSTSLQFSSRTPIVGVTVTEMYRVSRQPEDGIKLTCHSVDVNHYPLPPLFYEQKKPKQLFFFASGFKDQNHFGPSNTQIAFSWGLHWPKGLLLIFLKRSLSLEEKCRALLSQARAWVEQEWDFRSHFAAAVLIRLKWILVSWNLPLEFTTLSPYSLELWLQLVITCSKNMLPRPHIGSQLLVFSTQP